VCNRRQAARSSRVLGKDELNGKDNPAGRALNRRVVIIELP